MSGVAAPAPTRSGAPSAASADDLFALVKFVQSTDVQARLKELQEAEKRADERVAAAELTENNLRATLSSLQKQIAKHEEDKQQLENVIVANRAEMNQRDAALNIRDASVRQREDRCTMREREHETALAAHEAEKAQYEQLMVKRRKDLDRQAQKLDADRAALERKQAAVVAAMKS